MGIRVERIMSSEEFHTLNNKAMADGMYNTDPRVFKPGMAWYMDWYYDPTGERERAGKHQLFKEEHRRAILDNGAPSHLSMFYWREWSHLRPPICVMCPGDAQWVIDQKSSNGPGWTVNTIEPLSVHPSIDFSDRKGYHGFLTNGEFGRDLNKRF
jgi:hypothetical protein